MMEPINAIIKVYCDAGDEGCETRWHPKVVLAANHGHTVP